MNPGIVSLESSALLRSTDIYPAFFFSGGDRYHCAADGLRSGTWPVPVQG